MDKFKELMARCKCGVFLTVNEHRDYYQTAEQRLEELACRECPPEYTDDIRRKMVETDTIIELQFYPDTPIGSYFVIHHDLDAALIKALVMGQFELRQPWLICCQIAEAALWGLFS